MLKKGEEFFILFSKHQLYNENGYAIEIVFFCRVDFDWRNANHSLIHRMRQFYAFPFCERLKEFIGYVIE